MQRLQPISRERASKVLLLLLAILSLAYGSLTAYSGYKSRALVGNCISGSACENVVGQLQLQAAYGASRAELDFGAALMGLGLIVLLYVVLFTDFRKSIGLARKVR